MKSSRQLRAQRHQRLEQIRIGLFLILILITGLMIIFINNMMVSLILAFVTSYLVGPWVNALERQGLPRGMATTGVFLFIGTLLSVSFYSLFPILSHQLSSLKTEIPKYIQELSVLALSAQEHIDYFIPGTSELLDLSGRVQRTMTAWTEGLFETLPSILSRLLTISFLAPALAFFMIKDGRKITRGMMVLVPNRIFELVLSLYHAINDQLGQFVRARLMEGLIVGLIVWIGLLMAHVPYALAFGLGAGAANLIPYVGPFLGAIPPVVVVLLNGGTFFSVSVVGLVYIIAQLIDVFFIIPLVVAKIVNLHPLVVILSLLIGAQMMGILGLLISIPLASVLKVTASAVYQYIADR